MVLLYNMHLWRADRTLADRLRASRSPAPELDCTPRVSVLVAAWNEARHIDRHIRSFLKLRYPCTELILCAGGADQTFERARRYAGERVIVLGQQPGDGKQRALARCLEQATGEIIYLTDADCLFEDDALERLLAPLLNDGEQVATGRSRPLPEQERATLPCYLWAVDTMASARSGAYSDGLLGRNAAITRHALARIGGLNFVARTGTDYQLARRLLAAGITIRFVGESVIASEYPQSLRVYRHKQSRWLRNLLIYGWRYHAYRDLRQTAQTVATGVLMLLAPFAAILLGPLALMAWWLFVAHAAASKLRYILFAARLNGMPMLPRLFVALLPLTLVEFVVWASSLFDLLHRWRRERW